ncbi:MAG: DUF6526 family protein [Bacteroidia bacterium]
MSEQKIQNHANHSRYVPGYHFFLSTLIGALLIGSGVNLWESIVHHSGLYSASLICCLAVVCLFSGWYLRLFALRAQDRAIRAEENFRHYILTGKPLDQKLRMGQIIALRFAGDEEFPALAVKAMTEQLKPGEIKKEIKNWRPDFNRV